MHYLTGIGKSLDATLFAVMCWLLWKNRNKFVFEDTLAPFDKLHSEDKRHHKQITEAFAKAEHTLGVLGMAEKKMISWKLPPEGWACINTDGLVILALQSCTAGSVIRDD
ncbi:unnamed protein product [Linum trigynum]|uniref:Uncharacterized protein n=1 Tax=Linum trigynum TaxID=586398 RepID=A0AAV2FKG2_9ROSI